MDIIADVPIFPLAPLLSASAPSSLWLSPCNWVLIAFGTSLHGIDPEAGSLLGSTRLWCVNCCAGHKKWNPPLQGVVPVRELPLEMLLVKLIGFFYDVVWSWPLSVLVLGLLGGTLVSDAACDWPWATCLELPAIHSLWLPLLGLGVCGKDQTTYQGWLWPALALGQVSKSPKTLLLSLPPPDGWQLGLVTESLAVLHRVGQKGFQRVRLLFFPRPMQIRVECSTQESWCL